MRQGKSVRFSSVALEQFFFETALAAAVAEARRAGAVYPRG